MRILKRYRGFGIYERNPKEMASGQTDASYRLAIFLPEQSPALLDEPDHNTDSLDEAMEFIQSY